MNRGQATSYEFCRYLPHLLEATKSPLPFRGGSQAEKNLKALDFLLEGILDSFKKKIKELKLVGGWTTHLKNIKQIVASPQVGVKIQIFETTT